MLYEVITSRAFARLFDEILGRLRFPVRRETGLPLEIIPAEEEARLVITSYSIHYTKLYDQLVEPAQGLDRGLFLLGQVFLDHLAQPLFGQVDGVEDVI